MFGDVHVQFMYISCNNERPFFMRFIVSLHMHIARTIRSMQIHVQKIIHLPDMS